jgi:hypothetical protein
MPQNPEKYFYINRVGLARGSWALKKFEEDAERHHMSDQPAKLAALRLTEYYELIERLYAGGIPPAPGAAISSNGHAPAPTAAKKKGQTARPLLDDDEEDDGTQKTTQLRAIKPGDEAIDPVEGAADYWENL